MDVPEQVNFCLKKNKEESIEPYNERKEIFNPDIEQLIYMIIKEENYIEYNIAIKEYNKDGGNFLGDLVSVDITGKTEMGNKDLNIIIKKKIHVQMLEGFLDINAAYNHELVSYMDLLKIYNTLQVEANVPEEEKFKVVKCYKQSNKNAIVLENLQKKGYNTLHRMEVMTLRFAKLSIQQLAKFHGLSLILQYKKPAEYKRFNNIYQNVNLVNKEWMEFLKSLVNPNLHIFNKDIEKKVNNFYPIIEEKMFNYFNGITSSVKCFVHGDYRSNNILKKEIEGKIVEVIPIDYQLMANRSPVLDIIYFIYTGTDRKFRKEHMNDLLDIYHDALKYFLLYFDMDINCIYPKKQFLNDFFGLLDYGLMASLFVLTLCFANEDNLPDFNKCDDCVIKVNDGYKERMGDILEEFMEWGIL